MLTRSAGDLGALLSAARAVAPELARKAEDDGIEYGVVFERSANGAVSVSAFVSGSKSHVNLVAAVANASNPVGTAHTHSRDVGFDYVLGNDVSNLDERTRLYGKFTSFVFNIVSPRNGIAERLTGTAEPNPIPGAADKVFHNYSPHAFSFRF